MKFILNEKYILKEKMILTEAEDPEIVKILTEFENTYKTCATDFEKIKEKLSSLTTESGNFTNTQLLNKLEQVNKNITSDNLGDIEILKSSVKSAIESTETWLTDTLAKSDKSATLAGKFPQVNNVIDRLKDYTVAGKNANARDTDTDEKNIKAHWVDFYKLVSGLLSTSKTANSEDIEKLNANLGKILDSETLKTLNSDENKKIKDKAIIKIVNNLIESFNNLKTALDELSQKFDKDSGNLSATDYKNVISLEEQVLEIVSKLEDSKVMSAASKQAKKGSKSNTADWKAAIDLAETEEEKQQVWFKFYAATFGEANVDQIRKINLGTNAFASECLEFGFNENENPFIYFLKHNGAILKALDQFSYGALHNAFARGYVDSADLRGNGDLGTNSVIFSPSLYRDNYENLLEYLRLQDEALKYFKSGKFITNTLKQRYTNQNDFIIDLFYNPGNTLAVERKAGNIKNQIKTLLQIRKELEGCFGISVEANTQDNQQEELTDSALKVILAKIKTKEDAIAIVRYTYEKIRNAANVKKLVEVINTYPEIASAKLTERDIERVGGIVDNYNLKPTNFKGFVDTIAKAMKIKGNS